MDILAVGFLGFVGYVWLKTMEFITRMFGWEKRKPYRYRSSYIWKE